MKKRVRMLALALCIVSIFAVSAGALAATQAAATAAVAGAGEEAQALITGGSVGFRKGPGSGYDRIASLRKGTVVTVVDNTTNTNWWKVRTADGAEGYVSAKLLKLTDAAAADTSAQTAAADTAAQTAADSRKSAASAAQEKQTTARSSAARTAGSSKDVNAAKIAQAKAKNSDTIGWIQVPNTNIDDPILYAPNFYYANYNIDKKKSLEGVYPYYNKLTKNVAVFGHNLRGSASGMHALHHMQETALGYSRCQNGSCGRSLGSTHKNWQKDNRVWNISIFGKTRWEVFAMYEVKANEPISTLRSNWSPLSGQSRSSVQKWIDGQLARSEIDFGVSVSPSDTFLTLITCGTNYDSATANSRLFVFLKCVG